MPSLLTAVGAIFRALLLVAATKLFVQHNIWTPAEASKYAGDLAAFLAVFVTTVGYSLFKHYVYDRAIKLARLSPSDTPVAEIKQAANPIQTTPASMTEIVALADAAPKQP